MYINRHNKVIRQLGFSLWELSLVMLIMIGLFVALISVMPYIVKRENVEIDKSILIKMDEQLLGFIATYNRLPCPDNNNDGDEDCGGSNSTGTIPYKTLGLNEDYAGVGSIPVRYAVYRNTAASADLTTITNLFNPTDSHGTVTVSVSIDPSNPSIPAVINGLDFCTALSNANVSSFSATFAHIILPDNTTTRSVPYVLVTAGLADLDGGNSAFEGRNETNALDFESANKEHNASYDDTVYTKSFDELASSLNCDTAQRSLNLMADGKATHVENVAQAASIKASATLAAVITALQIVVGIANTAIAVATLIAAGVAVAGAATQLGVAIAACIASLGLACGGVAVAATALGFAIAAVIAAGLSIAANVTALILQGIALAKVIDVANSADATISIPTGSTDMAGNTTNNSDLAAQVRAQAEQFKKDAAIKVIAAYDSMNNIRSLAISIRSRFNVIKTRTQNLVNYNGTINDGILSFYANRANDQTAINLVQLNRAIPNITNATAAGLSAVQALGNAQNSGFPSFITTYPNANFPLAETHLMTAEPLTNSTEADFAAVFNSYLNIKTDASNAINRIQTLKAAQGARPVPADIFNPTAAEIAAIAAWDLRRSQLNTAQDRAQSIIDYMNTVINFPFDLRIILDYWIGLEVSRVSEAQGRTTEALGTITAALDAEANAAFFEANVGGANPAPTTTVVTLEIGVDAILLEADMKGVAQ